MEKNKNLLNKIKILKYKFIYFVIQMQIKKNINI